MKKKKEFNYSIDKWRCRMCGNIQGFLLNANKEVGKKLEEMILNTKIYHNEYPFEVRWCDNCKAWTRQEWVGVVEGDK